MKKITSLILAIIICSTFSGCMTLPDVPEDGFEKEDNFETELQSENGSGSECESETEVQSEPPVLRPDDFDMSADFISDSYLCKGSIRFQYRLYLPEGYDENEKYPLLVYLHSTDLHGKDNERPLAEAEMLLKNPQSPVFSGIILVPQCPKNRKWEGRVVTALNQLTDHINETYSTDPERQYYVGSTMGANAVWDMIDLYPERVSGAIVAGGNSITMMEYYDGTIIPLLVREDYKQIPICITYSTTDVNAGKEYSTMLYNALINDGAENIILKEVEGKDPMGPFDFAGEDDIEVLLWLYGQKRATFPVKDEPTENIDRIQFDSNSVFEYGEFTSSRGITLPYRYYIPENYDETKKYPVLMFLHSNGLQGTDNTQQMYLVDPYFQTADSPVYETIVVAPQCPEGLWWRTDALHAVVELFAEINSKYSTDTSRQYAAGVSMGGDGVWGLIRDYPEVITAGIPVAGASFGDDYKNGIVTFQKINEKSLDVRICCVYDTTDQYFPMWYQRGVVRLLQKLGAVNFTFRETSGYGHNICGRYVGAEDMSVVDWLYEQSRETSNPYVGK